MTKRSKTLIIQPLQGIGDYMWFLRHIQAIAAKTPEKTVTLLTRPRSKADLLAEEEPAIEDVIWLEMKPGPHDRFLGLVELARTLRKHKFREAWILHSRSLRYPLVCRLAGIRNVYGPGMGVQRRLLSAPEKFLTKTEQKQHPIYRATALLRHHGLSLEEGKKKGYIPLSKKIQEEVQKDFGSVKTPWIGLCISSSEVEKKWPASYFIELGEKLFEATKGTLFILGGPAETGEGMTIQGALQQKKIPAVFVTGDLRRTLHVVQGCSFVVGNDTGVTHSAPMMGSRGFVLLGHAQVAIHKYAPVEGLRASESDIVSKDPNNMGALTPDQVMKKLSSLGWV